MTSKKRGKIIAIEGIDGSGKTTVSTEIYSFLSSKGVPIYYSFEPTYTKIGSIIHRFLRGEIPLDSHSQALLFAADRLEHLSREIIPYIKQGKNVILDRYVHSSYAYQGALLNDLKWIMTINKFALAPDLAIYIDVPPSVAIRRIRKKGRSNISVYESVRFLGRVRNIYKSFVKKGELIEIDGTKEKDQVVKSALAIVCKSLKIKLL
ncbi:MAG: dTMP kinase [Thermoproteota archaeon]|nr:dTMP kinase [Candidatus Brockarchaeota archaeon]MBO3768003.1 dTMP kinase [Candidatus Brockarchaeota archaeon]MBO3801689.1 dTMP kinase [Candidatus Brockarchaeota archaeon]